MLDIVVPVYNEGGNIKKLFEQINMYISTPKNIILVYDFDEDNTLPVVMSLKDNYNFSINLIKNKYGNGALNAIKTGLVSSAEDAVLVIMADLSDNLDVVDEMYSLVSNGYDLVCGSRYMKGGKQLGGPLLKKIISRMAGITLHYLIRIPTHDITNSFKMYARKVIQNIPIESTGGFELGMEITVKAYVKKYKITEVPSTWHDRVNGESNFKMWAWIPKYIHWYLYGIINTWFRRI